MKRHLGKWIICLLLVSLIGAVVLPNFFRARERSRATRILNDARLLDAAVDQWAIQQNKAPEDKVTWEDLAPYLNPNTRLRQSEGKDLWGNPFLIGPTKEDGVKFSPETLKRYDSSVVPSSFWEKYQ